MNKGQPICSASLRGCTVHVLKRSFEGSKRRRSDRAGKHGGSLGRSFLEAAPCCPWLETKTQQNDTQRCLGVPDIKTRDTPPPFGACVPRVAGRKKEMRCESLRFKLIGGLAVRRACYGVLRSLGCLWLGPGQGVRGWALLLVKRKGRRAQSSKCNALSFSQLIHYPVGKASDRLGR